MYPKKTRAWLLSAAMTIGVAGIAPTFVFAADRDREEWVKYEDVPREVKRTLDRERGNHDIKRIDHVVRDGREFYRATIDTKGDDAVIRVNPSGTVLSRQETRDEPVGNERRDVSERRDRGDVASDRRSSRDESTVVKYASLPERVKETLDRERGNREVKIIYLTRRGDRTYYNAIVDERNGDRSVRINEGGKLLSEEDIREARTAGGRYDGTSDLRRGIEDDGDRVAFDRLPGEVKTALGREAGQDRVGNVYRYDRRGGTVYEAEVYSPLGTRVIRVNENGRVVSEDNANPEGRRTVRYDDLPGRVKESLGRTVSRDRASRVVEITQNGRTYYRVQQDNGRDRDPTWITVDEDGREVRDFGRGR
jgi:hypothetical protein